MKMRDPASQKALASKSETSVPGTSVSRGGASYLRMGCKNLRSLAISVLISGNLKMRPGETVPPTRNVDTNFASRMLLLQPHLYCARVAVVSTRELRQLLRASCDSFCILPF